MMHLEIIAQSAPKAFRYKLVEQGAAPDAGAWNALPWRPFLDDMFFYRRPLTQWITLEVTDSANIPHVLTVALQGGSLTAPPDDPILPADYVTRINRGFDASFSEFGPRIADYQESGIVAFKKAGIDHLRIRTNFPATQDDLFWHFDRSVDETLRHGLYPIVAFQGTDVGHAATEEDKLAAVAWWRAVSERYATRSHKVSFNLFVELLGSEALSNWPTLNSWYGPITEAIRDNTARHNIIYTSIKISNPCQLVNYANQTSNLLVPASAGDYYFTEWHNWAAGPSLDGRNGWVGYDGTAAFREDIRTNIQCALDWTSISGKPTWVGAWMPGLFNTYDDHWYTTEAVEFSKYLTEILATLPGFTQTGAYTQTRIPWAVNADHKYYDMTTGVWYPEYLPMMEAINGPVSINPNDPDGDGLDASAEAARGTSPTNADTDHDLILDPIEIQYGLDPLNPADGLEFDTDGDGMPNKFEAQFAFDLNDPADAAEDFDGDGLSNLWDYLLTFNPTDKFTGKSTVTDGQQDSDGDGLSNQDEVNGNAAASPPVPSTDPRKRDTDADGLDDRVEITWPATSGGPYDPNDADMDDDGLLDGAEVRYGLNPRNPGDGAAADTDLDLVNNGDEIQAGLNPTAGYDGLGPSFVAATYQQKLGAGIDMAWSPWQSSNPITLANRLAERGFDHVRIQVRDAATTTLFVKLDAVVQNMLRAGVMPVISYDVPTAQSDMTVPANRDAFVAWWNALAGHYAQYSHKLAFDLTDKIVNLTFADTAQANLLMNDAATAIRSSRPTRIVIFQAPPEGRDSDLTGYALPAQAQNYALARFQFRQNGPVKWVSDNAAERATITNTLQSASAWQAQSGNIPVYHSTWRSYKGTTFTLSEQIAFSQYMTGAMRYHANIPGSVTKLEDYLSPGTLVWDPAYTALVDVFVSTTPGAPLMANSQTRSAVWPHAGENQPMLAGRNSNTVTGPMRVRGVCQPLALNSRVFLPTTLRR